MARSFTVQAPGIPEMRKICSPHLVDGGFPAAGSGPRGWRKLLHAYCRCPPPAPPGATQLTLFEAEGQKLW